MLDIFNIKEKIMNLEDNTKNKVIKILNEFGINFSEEDDIDLTTFIDDSIIFINMILELEQEFNIIFPDELLDMSILTSFNRLVIIIQEQIINRNINDAITDLDIVEYVNEITKLEKEISELDPETDREKIIDYKVRISDLQCMIKDKK